MIDDYKIKMDKKNALTFAAKMAIETNKIVHDEIVLRILRRNGFSERTSQR